jgi:A/G-specific adenine glycosylase
MTPLAADLLAWYDVERRILPWREDVSPYRTWISETMLQQTRVDTVLPYFDRFMGRFPHVHALASAPLDEVLSLWSGLGYYSRARNLHKAAHLIVERGAFPDTVSTLAELPGVGPYMAGAIASIALGRDVPTVDGNIARVMARVHRDAGKPAGMWGHAEHHLPEGRAGDHNQALMDLGATICTPRTPRCECCPVQAHCAAFAVGDVADFPPPKPRKKVPIWAMTCALVRSGDRVLLGQRKPSGLFGGLYEPPMFRVQDGGDASAALSGCLRQQLQLEVATMAPVRTVRHVLTHRVLVIAVHEVEARGEPLPGPYERLMWWQPGDAENFGLSTLARRALGMVK